MKPTSMCIGFFLALVVNTVAFARPKPLDVDAATTEVSTSYGKAEPEVQEFVLHTARSFGRDALWLNENAYEDMKPADREARIAYLVKLFDEAEYGHHLCSAQPGHLVNRPATSPASPTRSCPQRSARILKRPEPDGLGMSAWLAELLCPPHIRQVPFVHVRCQLSVVRCMAIFTTDN